MNTKTRIRTGWYLQEPFNDPASPQFFDRENWWTNDSDSRIAAVYELVRRHPATGDMLLGERKPRNQLDRFLAECARKSWPRLAPDAHEDFTRLFHKGSVANLSRVAREKAGPLDFAGARDAVRDSSQQRWRKYERRKQMLEKHGQAELTALAQLAREEAIKGRLIVSLAIDGEPDGLADEVAQLLRSEQERIHQQVSLSGRDTSQGRLKKITRFEQSECERFWNVPKTGKRKQRCTPLPRKWNQNERRAFERVCQTVDLSLSRDD